MVKLIDSVKLPEESIRARLLELERLVPGLELRRTRVGARQGQGRVDFAIDARMGPARRTILIEVKTSATPAALHEVANRLRVISSQWPNSYPMVVAPYISPRGRAVLRRSDVGFLDLQGNCFLQFNGIYIDREQPEKPQTRKRQQRNLFAPVSSRIHRVLLANAQRSWKISELAQEADVSLGLTHRVVRRLLADMFLQKQGRLLVLHEPGQLLGAWRDAYDFSKNIARSYHAAARTPTVLMQKISLVAGAERVKYGFTLHSGASLRAPFVRFTDVHVYIDSDADRWVDALDLRSVEFGGNLSLIQPYDEGVFYAKQDIDGKAVVSDVQLYLDLYHYPRRGREQAEFLREQRLQF